MKNAPAGKMNHLLPALLLCLSLLVGCGNAAPAASPEPAATPAPPTAEELLLQAREEGYAAALRLQESGDYAAAEEAFLALENFRDSGERAAQCREARLEAAYAAAEALEQAGEDLLARDVYGELGQYRDAAERAEECRLRGQSAALQQAQVGDTVCFGRYEQDNDAENGTEDIEWLVLERKNGRLLLLSRYILDSRCYHPEFDRIIWENSALRSWLNAEFLQSAFAEPEQERILEVSLQAEAKPSYIYSRSNSTKDRVFLLSSGEAQQYFPTAEERCCLLTAYAVAQGAYIDNSTGCGWWWLRSPGYYLGDAASVYYEGSVNTDRHMVDLSNGGVRPAIWVSVEP